MKQNNPKNIGISTSGFIDLMENISPLMVSFVRHLISWGKKEQGAVKLKSVSGGEQDNCVLANAGKYAGK